MVRKRMFFDIETSPNVGIFWRAGYNLTITPYDIIQERAIICVCWKWEGSDEVHSLTWDKNHCDKKLLKKFVKELEKADEAIAHNGDRFDIKWLRTRALFHGVNMNHTINTIDTLKWAKSGFNFNSNKLDYIAQFLGVGKKMETGGLDLWKKICLEKCGESLVKMVDYCKQDVVILEKVFQKLNPYSKPKTHYAVLRSGEKFQCPECGKLANYKSMYTTAQGTIQHRMQCSDRKECRKQFKINNKTYQEYLKFKARLIN
jgi:uncharacterized protein YprB with RNaseH-like and TPR domain